MGPLTDAGLFLPSSRGFKSLFNINLCLSFSNCLAGAQWSRIQEEGEFNKRLRFLRAAVLGDLRDLGYTVSASIRNTK